jgi:hypothetical protein
MNGGTSMTDITTPKPADLISSLRLLEPKRMAAFRQAAAPLTADPKALPKKFRPSGNR